MNFDAFADHLDALTQPVARSNYLGMLLEQAAVPADQLEGMMRASYGIEMVPVAEKNATRSTPIGFSLSRPKNMIVAELADFVEDRFTALNDAQITNYLNALKMASLQATIAEIDHDGELIPDARYQTCVAVAHALTQFIVNAGAGNPHSKTACNMLVELAEAAASAPYDRLDYYSDLGVIKGAFLDSVDFLIAASPDMARLVLSSTSALMQDGKATLTGPQIGMDAYIFAKSREDVDLENASVPLASKFTNATIGHYMHARVGGLIAASDEAAARRHCNAVLAVATNDGFDAAGRARLTQFFLDTLEQNSLSAVAKIMKGTQTGKKPIAALKSALTAA